MIDKKRCRYRGAKLNSQLFRKIGRAGLIVLSSLTALCIWLLGLYALNFV